MSDSYYEFQVDINVINHLGVGLYSSTPAALAELVANSWDAEANNVDIKIELGRDSSIIILDDGHGMSDEDVRTKFLKVGFSRRGPDSSNNKTLNGKRYVMGRKGIGKLAMLALSEKVIISTQKKGEIPISFEIEVDKFKEAIRSKGKAKLKNIPIRRDYFESGHGTEIKLINTHKNITTTENYLRTRLARRFSVRPEKGDKFNIKINGVKVTHKDRKYYDKIRYLWYYDDKSLDDIRGIANLKRKNIEDKDEESIKSLDTTLAFEGHSYDISGFIASVQQPSDLGRSEESANMISIFANGKVFAEDVLATELGDAKYFNNYLTGEIHADFLDLDDIDRATANREAIKKQDPLYKALISKLKKDMLIVSADWDEWRRSSPLDENEEETKAIKQWVDGLHDRRDKKSALRIMSTIQRTYKHENAETEKKMKKSLYQNVIIGYESLKLRGGLDRLEKITDVLSPEFQEVFMSFNYLESLAYANITKERLAIIEKFKDIIDDAATLEAVAQEYLFDNLWLLDPSWDRVSMNSTEMEVRLTNDLKDRTKLVNGDSRLDLTYQTSG
ncbi:MAG TPA: ATP-binding protein, partial [Tissierellaceae bacterium]